MSSPFFFILDLRAAFSTKQTGSFAFILPWQFARQPADISNLVYFRLSKSLHSTIFLFGYQMNRTTADYGECKQDPSFNLRFITKHAFIT